MRKLTLLLLATLFAGLQAIAITANPKPFPVPQPDGTILSVKLVGDEHYHYNTTADGYTIMLNEAGAYVYAQRDGSSIKPTSVLAHDEGARDLQELTLLENTDKNLTDQVASLRAKRVRLAPRHVDLADFDWDTFQGLVILIDFKDKTFAIDNPQSFYDHLFNTEGLKSYVDSFTGEEVSCMGSVYDYFTQQSNGIFTPHFDVFGPYTSSYRADQFTDRNTASIFRTILNEADADVDFSRYDANHDGKVDMVAFIVAGYSAAHGNNENYLWPHESVLDAARKDGLLLDRYSSSTELYGQENNPRSVHVDGIGTICHEFSHVLGLPDFYDTDNTGSGGASHVPGTWDLMASGNYNDEGRTPAGYSLYERYALGWVQPQVITAEGNYTLQPVNETPDGYILLTPQEGEFFVIDNRQKTGWDTFLPGHGMMVTRVDSTNLDVWSTNSVNCSPAHNYLELIRAAGTITGDKPSDPFPGTMNVTSLTNETLPTLKNWAGEDNEFQINDIAENDGVVTFKIKKAQPSYFLIEDFEDMPATTNQSAANVQGAFTTWTFIKANVSQPGSGKCIGQHGVTMRLGGRLSTTTPINEDISGVSAKVFNTMGADIKYRLEYSTDNGTTWTIAKTTTGKDAAEISAYTQTIVYWDLAVDKSQSTLMRITQIAGNKTCYIDDIALYYHTTQDYATGDVNGDGEVNIADVNVLISIILANGNIDAELQQRCDVNNDNEINVADVNNLISIVLRS